MVEKLPLKHSHCLGRQLIAALRALESLLGGHVLDEVLHLLFEFVEFIELPCFGKSGESLHVDQTDLRILSRFFELLQKLRERFQFFLHLESLWQRKLLAAAELPCCGEFVHLIHLAETIHQRYQLPAKTALVVVLRIPQTLELPQLLFPNGSLECIARLCRWLDLLGCVLKYLPRFFANGVGFVPFDDFSDPLFQHVFEGRQGWPQPRDLRRIEHDRIGQLLFGEFIDAAELQ